MTCILVSVYVSRKAAKEDKIAKQAIGLSSWRACEPLPALTFIILPITLTPFALCLRASVFKKISVHNTATVRTP